MARPVGMWVCSACATLAVTQAWLSSGYVTPRSQEWWSLGSPSKMTAPVRHPQTWTRLSMSVASPTSTASIADSLLQAAEGQGRLALQSTFAALAKNPEFLAEYWQQQPWLCTASLPNLAGAFTMQHVEHEIELGFLEAGRGTFTEGKTGWQMAAVSQPRGKSFEEAKLRYQDVEEALKQKSGTVVVNSAGVYMPPLAGVCLEAVEAFQMPAGLNLYLTAPGQATSAPPHTDKQDVIVMQTQGKKRWRVYAPPPPAKKAQVDPMARGKGLDHLDLAELGAPLLDTVLQPGQMLYMPAGFPHTTDTVTGLQDEVDPSVHLTLGIDSHIWGLNYASLRQYCLGMASLPDPQDPLTEKAPPGGYWGLHTTLPLGFLGEPIMQGHKRWSEMKGALMQEMSGQLVRRMREAGDQLGDRDDADVLQELKAEEVMERVIAHHAKMVAVNRDMYADIRYKLNDVPMDLSFFRAKPYLQAMEKTMEDLVQWAAPPKPKLAPSKGFGTGVSPRAPAKKTARKSAKRR